ncbi:MAG: hypothetical protein KAI64_01835 [Thermoplasmata archaeon]|nr:hypothetical protein [Thermoplasmata archaeon]
MPKELESLLKGTTGLIQAEDLAIEAVKDLVKDEIKKYVLEKLNANPELKKELKEAVEEYLEAKVKEVFALLKVGKCAAKLGLELIPSSLKGEITKDIVSLFEKEINLVLEKTL